MQALSKTLKRWLQREGEAPTLDDLTKRNMELETQVEQASEQLSAAQENNRELCETIGRLENDLGVVVSALDRDVPGIAEQTEWPTGFYDFGKAKTDGVRFFNTSIVSHEDQDWLIARRASPDRGMVHGVNDIVAFSLKDNHPQVMLPIWLSATDKGQHFEDPRAMWINGRVHISFTSFIAEKGILKSYAHQMIAQTDANWRSAAPFHPMYGANGGSARMNIGHEKNWLWFDHEGVSMFVYSNEPHVVVEMPDLAKPTAVHKTETKNPYWMHGEIRGGTPPVRIGDEYVSFFHSSLPWVHKKRRYHMGAYTFEAKPPFKIKRSTILPLLSGSRNDPWVEGLPLVVFPCGAVYRNGEWLVTLGVNDCESAWIKIPHNDLMARMRDL